MTHIHLAIRNLVGKSEIIQTTYTYNPYSKEAAQAQLKIEANISESQSFYPLVPIEITIPDDKGAIRQVSVVSYDLDEMFGTKLRALLQREQGRDLFGLWHAWKVSEQSNEGIKVDPARMGAAFRFYMEQEGSTFDSTEVRLELERRMSSKKFLSDMNNSLPVGRVYSPRQAYEEFCVVFLPHLDG